ncbi:MAG: hypothetical protein U0165_04495 [Polyangiaceae bacterium]
MSEAAQAFPGTKSKLQSVFPKLSAYSKEYQPGYVHGLAMGRLPVRQDMDHRRQLGVG